MLVNIVDSFVRKKLTYLLIKTIKLYLIYINDIILLWTGTLEELKRFQQEVNICYSEKHYNFINALVCKMEACKLGATLYRGKKLIRKPFLHRRSEHHESLKKSIPFAQALYSQRI